METDLMTWWLEKESFDIPLQEGVILNDASKLDEKNTLSVKEIINTIAGYKQLLINNDFQVNQRSQIAYSGEMKKCYDGWLLIRGFVTNIAYATYPKPKDGILMVYNTNYENNQLWQFLDEELDYEKYYTLSYAADGVHYSFTFKPTPTGYQENIHDRFRVYTALESSRQKRAICVELFQGKAINLEYIDLFEGKIAYQHKKEDYAITELKCSKKLKYICPNNNAASINIGMAYVNNYTTSATRYRVYFAINASLDTIPTISYNDLRIYFYNGRSYNVDACSFYNIANGVVNVTMEFNINDGFSPIDKPCAVYVYGYLSASCETV